MQSWWFHGKRVRPEDSYILTETPMHTPTHTGTCTHTVLSVHPYLSFHRTLAARSHPQVQPLHHAFPDPGRLACSTLLVCGLVLFATWNRSVWMATLSTCYQWQGHLPMGNICNLEMLGQSPGRLQPQITASRPQLPGAASSSRHGVTSCLPLPHPGTPSAE